MPRNLSRRVFLSLVFFLGLAAWCRAEKCLNAVPIEGYVFGHTIDISAFTVEPGEPQSCAPITESTWYRFHSDSATVLNLTTLQTLFPTAIAVYSGSCADLQLVKCEAAPVLQRLKLEGGQDYFIQVGGQASGELVFGATQRGNVRLAFPQVAVGDVVSSQVDLFNRGTATFSGSLAILNPDGGFLDALADGTPITDDIPLVIAPGQAMRIELTRTGSPLPGHLIVFDRRILKEVDLDQLIDGSMVYRFEQGGQLFDSVGVPAAGVMFTPGVREHFYFFATADQSRSIRTGLAVSNPGSPFFDTIPVRLKVLDAAGLVLNETQVLLPPLGQLAFFLEDVMTLPSQYRGTVTVTSPVPVFALALRSEGSGLETMRLSSVPVSPATSVYDFEFTLPGGTYKGEMSLNIADIKVGGLLRFTSHVPDKDFEITPIVGAATAGNFIASLYTSFGGSPATLILYSVGVSTALEAISGGVVWMGLGGTQLGSFTAQRRQPYY